MGCMTLTPAQMDRDATAAAARHRAGETDEEQLRRELAEILARSGQVVSEADRFLGRGSDKQVRADLIEELNRMEFDRVLTHPGFHPTRMLEDSFAGYIRKHLWYDSKDAYRRLKIRTTDKFHLSDDMTTVKPTASSKACHSRACRYLRDCLIWPRDQHASFSAQRVTWKGNPAPASASRSTSTPPGPSASAHRASTCRWSASSR